MTLQQCNGLCLAMGMKINGKYLIKRLAIIEDGLRILKQLFDSSDCPM